MILMTFDRIVSFGKQVIVLSLISKIKRGHADISLNIRANFIVSFYYTN
jgi:hypothetical protein